MKECHSFSHYCVIVLMSGNEGMRELFVGISLKKSLFEGHKYPGYLIAPKRGAQTQTWDEDCDTSQDTIHYIYDPSRGDIK